METLTKKDSILRTFIKKYITQTTKNKMKMHSIKIITQDNKNETEISSLDDYKSSKKKGYITTDELLEKLSELLKNKKPMDGLELHDSLRERYYKNKYNNL